MLSVQSQRCNRAATFCICDVFFLFLARLPCVRACVCACVCLCARWLMRWTWVSSCKTLMEFCDRRLHCIIYRVSTSGYPVLIELEWLLISASLIPLQIVSNFIKLTSKHKHIHTMKGQCDPCCDKIPQTTLVNSECIPCKSSDTHTHTHTYTFPQNRVRHNS